MIETSIVPTRSVEFGPLTVRFDTRVLTPRPWTLLQSRWAVELATRAVAGPILELCAGAGQIGLAAAVLSDRDLVQVEADPVAARYAVLNAEIAGRADRVDVRPVRMDAALAPGERFPIILADPPYLLHRDLGLWPDDPAAAIDGGADGLDVIRGCLRVARDHLTETGALLLQLAGEDQVGAVVELLEATAQWGLEHRRTRQHDRDRAVSLLVRSGT